MHETTPKAAAQPKHLLLVGAGHAHLHVLQRLAQQRSEHSIRITVIAPDAWQTYSGMVPGYIAGRYPLDACRIALQPLLRAAGAAWIQGLCTGIDAAGSHVQVRHLGSANAAQPRHLGYDVISLDTGAVFDPQRLTHDMPGALEHTLPVRPIDVFCERWQAMLAPQHPPATPARAPSHPAQTAKPSTGRATTVAFIGAGAASIELLMAAHQRFTTPGAPATTEAAIQLVLVTGGRDLAAGYSSSVQRRVLRQLRIRQVHIVHQRCVGAQAGALQLEDGSLLACDAAVLAVGTDAPSWLKGSGLALADSGHLLVNAFQQSTSHANVFAAGDVATRADAPHPKSGVYAVRAGPALARNLLAAVNGQPLTAYQPPARTLNLLSCGTGHAILSWGPLHTEGAWAWQLKDTIDRAFIARYAAPDKGGDHL